MAASVFIPTEGTDVSSQGIATADMDILQKSYWQFDFSDIMFRYVSPTILVVGLLGNSLSLMVLQSRSMRIAAASFLLSVLAVSDMGCLLTTLLNQWLQTITNYRVNMRMYNVYACKIHLFLTYLFHQLSTMTLSFITIQKVISVYLPLKAKIICSRGNTIKVWTGVAILLAGFNSMAFFLVRFDSIDRSYSGCFYGREIWIWFNNVDAAIECYLPISIILIGNVLILMKVKLQQKKMKQHQTNNRDEHRSTSSDRMTTLLIVVTTSFVLLITPFYVWLNGLNYWHYNSEDFNTRALSAAFRAAAYHLFELNFAINFILYCAFGVRFRSALIEMLRLRKKSKQKPVSMPTERAQIQSSYD